MSTTPFILAGGCRAALFVGGHHQPIVFSGQCGLIPEAFRWRVRSAFGRCGHVGFEIADAISDELAGNKLPPKRMIRLASPARYGVRTPAPNRRNLVLSQLCVVRECLQAECSRWRCATEAMAVALLGCSWEPGAAEQMRFAHGGDISKQERHRAPYLLAHPACSLRRSITETITETITEIDGAQRHSH
jgi:hypothetical protein